jgi:hypothetical protein
VSDLVCAFFAHTANNRKEYNFNYHNLDLVFLVGYRVNSKRLQEFTNVQKMHIVNTTN